MARCEDRIDYYLDMKDGVKQRQADIDHMNNVARHSYNLKGCNAEKNARNARRSFVLAKQTMTRQQREYYKKCVDKCEERGVKIPTAIRLNASDTRSQAKRTIGNVVAFMVNNGIETPAGVESIRCRECKYWSRTYADYGNCRCHHKSRKAEWGCGAGEARECAAK